MGDCLTKHMIIDIGMRIDMDRSHWPVLARNGTQHRQAKGMVTTKGQRHHVMRQNFVVKGRDTGNRTLIESVDWHITKITDPKQSNELRVHIL